MAKGELLFFNAGDDISYPERAEALASRYMVDQPYAIDSDMDEMDASGRLLGRIKTSGHIINNTVGLSHFATRFRSPFGASCAWRTDLYDIFGPMTEVDAYEDMVLFFRAYLAGPIAHIPKPLLSYRMNGQSQLSNTKPYHRLKRFAVHGAVLRQRKKDFACYQEILNKRFDGRILDFEKGYAGIDQRIKRRRHLKRLERRAASVNNGV